MPEKPLFDPFTFIRFLALLFKLLWVYWWWIYDVYNIVEYPDLKIIILVSSQSLRIYRPIHRLRLDTLRGKYPSFDEEHKPRKLFRLEIAHHLSEINLLLLR